MIALLGDRLRRRVLPEMERAFHYPTTHAEEFRILCQEPEARPAPRERRRAGVDEPGADFTLSVSLNAGEYRGGEWRFTDCGPELYAPTAGAALVFARPVDRTNGGSGKSGSGRLGIVGRPVNKKT